MLRMTEERKSRGLSMSALARRAEMHVSSISQIESGHLIPYEKQMAKIAKALNWEDDPKELFAEVPR
ncbi:MAG: helix-turn-helix transcriptional regulator [Eggerthellaceae bacterium]|nr:helix-turn-helix transcriptional regulator [Eggerthellaceae bacterium]